MRLVVALCLVVSPLNAVALAQAPSVDASHGEATGFPAIAGDGARIAYRAMYTGCIHVVRIGSRGLESFCRMREPRAVAELNARFVRQRYRPLARARVTTVALRELGYGRDDYRKVRHVVAVSAGRIVRRISRATPRGCGGPFVDVEAWIDPTTRLVFSRWHHTYCAGDTNVDFRLVVGRAGIFQFAHHEGCPGGC